MPIWLAYADAALFWWIWVGVVPWFSVCWTKGWGVPLDQKDWKMGGYCALIGPITMILFFAQLNEHTRKWVRNFIRNLNL